MRINNCLCFALNRWFKNGGYLIIRKSRIGWWWHFLWAKDLEGLNSLEHFVPDKERLDSELVGKIMFEGHIKREDRP